jgi:hypothetical protein
MAKKQKHIIKFDKTNERWDEIPEFVKMYCKCGKLKFEERYKHMGYLHLTDIYEYFGVKCPKEHIRTTFVTEDKLRFQFKFMDDCVFIICTWS